LTYYLGNVVTLSTTVEVNGIPTNASAMTLTVQNPDGSTTSPSLSNTSTGIYSVAFTPTLPGHYVYRFLATGTGASATEGEFDVRAVFTPGIVSLVDVKSFLNFPANDNGSSDAKIQEFIDAATEIVEGVTGPLVPETVTNVFNGGLSFIVLPERNVVSITSLTENRGLTNYTLTNQPLGQSIDAFGYTWDRTIQKIVRRGFGGGTVLFAPGEDNVVCTYVVGLGLIPGNVTMACLELIRHWWQWGQMGLRPSLGNPNSGAGDETPSVSNAYAVPNRVLELLMPHKRGPGIA
jgi:hypothetical protein